MVGLVRQAPEGALGVRGVLELDDGQGLGVWQHESGNLTWQQKDREGTRDRGGWGEGMKESVAMPAGEVEVSLKHTA